MAFTKNQRIKVYSKYNGKCAYCGAEIQIKEMQVDHIIPQREFERKIKNGFNIPKYLSHLTVNDLNHIDNLNPSCRVCNNWKSDFNLEFFRSELLEQIRRLNEYSSNYRIAKRYGLIKETNSPIVFYFESISRHQENDKGVL